VQWSNVKKCVLDTVRNLVRKVERRSRKPLITHIRLDLDEEQELGMLRIISDELWKYMGNCVRAAWTGRKHLAM
jgi:hypothetical protein